MNKKLVQPKLPAVKKLFTDSWDALKKHFVKLLQLYAIGFGATFAIIIVFLLIATLFGAGTLLLDINKGIMPTELGPMIFVVAVFAIIALISLIIIFSVLQIATILVISGKSPKQSPLKTFENSFQFIGPLVGAGVLSTLLILGGIFLFIIPGVLFSLFFTFLSYEVVLNNQTGLNALKRSYLIFTQNFWGILGRILLLVIVSIIFSSLLNLLTRNSGGASGLFSLISLFGNLIFSWFSVCYSLFIYKEASVGLESAKSKNITWIVIVSIIGWILAIIIVFFGFSVFNAYRGSQQNPENQPQSLPQASALESTPSSTSAY